MSVEVLDRVVDLPTVTSLPAKRRPIVNRKRLALAGGALLLSLGAARVGSQWWTVGRFIESTDDAYVGGEVTAIAPKVAGSIAEVPVVDNQAVKAGDLLLKLDDRDFRAALARTEAAVAGQQAGLANLDAGRSLQEAMVTQAEAEVTAVEADIVRTRDDQSRYRQLAATNAASQQSFQKADADFKKAIAAGQKARAALVAAQRQLVVIDTQKDQARAALAQADAERQSAVLNLEYASVRAPIDGTIGNRSGRVGAYVTTGAQVMAIVPARGLWVDANFKESQLAVIAPGMPATVVADVAPGRVFHGHVASLAPATGAEFSVLPPENATGNFTKIVQRVPVRILLDGDSAALGVLRPGLSVTAEVDHRSELAHAR